jgi:hypothetical protein
MEYCRTHKTTRILNAQLYEYPNQKFVLSV